MENVEEVLIERDYSNGIVPAQFLKDYPDKLEGKITKEEFNELITRINQLLDKAESTGCDTFVEGLFGCLTLFTMFLVIDGKYAKEIKKLEKYVEDQNTNLFKPKGMILLNPFYNGLQQIEIIIQNN
eukprot:TRINITY_DN2442_c0_g1_i1.p1 TRINITY_DN2442_c0_g1~~TRINITY_DN2442_c0_g1_i1.p1  ORF type:complete len:127 (-),score=34.81 TRINITY_DN2442_c0_g1_i1:302-682(-)